MICLSWGILHTLERNCSTLEKHSSALQSGKLPLTEAGFFSTKEGNSAALKRGILHLTSHKMEALQYRTLEGNFAAQEGTGYKEILQHTQKRILQQPRGEFCSTGEWKLYRDLQGNSAALENGNYTEIYRGILQHWRMEIMQKSTGEFCSTLQGNSAAIYRNFSSTVISTGI